MFRIGQKVICIASDPHPLSRGPQIVVGRIYTVSWVGRGFDVDLVDWFDLIDLVELPSPEDENFNRGWIADHFRPVATRKTDISIFTAMLTPSPVTVDVMNVADHAREIVG